MHNRICPLCSENIYHTSKYNRNSADKAKRICNKCKGRNIRVLEDSFYNTLDRNCPICKGVIQYTFHGDKIKAEQNKTCCKTCMINTGKFKKGSKINDVYNYSNNSIKILLEESNESFYWLGFIIADGYFKNNLFELGLSIKDLKHLEKFGEFISFRNTITKYKNACRIGVSDRISVKQVREKYGFVDKKTYNPIDFKFFENYSYDLLLSLLIGIIDGDGCISYNGSHCITINVTSHINWRYFFICLFNRLQIIPTIRDIRNTNVLNIGIGKSEYILTLSAHIKENNLPILNRKWNKIYEGDYLQRATRRRENVLV